MPNHLNRILQENEQLIAVSPDNVPLHPVEKIVAHQNPGTLHRAITVFLYNPTGELLVTQRSASKPLWPLWWDAACSTHQWWPEESALAAAERRLPFEIGISVDSVSSLQEQFHYEYHAVYNDAWAENEINFIVTGTTSEQPKLNADEVAVYEWLSPEKISAELAQSDHRFAPWFPLAWERITAEV